MRKFRFAVLVLALLSVVPALPSVAGALVARVPEGGVGPSPAEDYVAVSITPLFLAPYDAFA